MPLTLIHFGDLHVWRYGWDGDFFFKRILGLLNLRLRRSRKFPPALAREVLAHLAREHADAVLFSGDLTTMSLRAEFITGRALLEPLFARWGDAFLTIPGNHDRYTPRATSKKLYETLVDHRRPAKAWAHDLDARWTALAIDTCVPRHVSSQGFLDPEAMSELEKLLKKTKARGRAMLVVGHYPISYPEGFTPKPDHVLPDRERLLNLLQQYGVAVYLHGHQHRRWRLQRGGLSIIDCGAAGYQGSIEARMPGYVRLMLGEAALETATSIYLNKGKWIEVNLPASP